MNYSNKRTGVRLTLAGLVLGICASLYAQDPGGNKTGAYPNGVESQRKTISAVVRRGGAQSQIKAFFKELEEKDQVKMVENINRRPKEQGGDYFVAIGKAAISAHRSSKDWVTSRAIAFDKAMNDAKGKLLVSVVAEVETRTRQTLEESSSGVQASPESEGQGGEAAKHPGIFDKLTKLTHNKLDDMLAKQGGKPNSNDSAKPSKAEVDKVMRTEEFKTFVRMGSQAVVAGMQAFQTFEDLQSGRNGEIVVIGIVSEKTLDLASSVGSGAPIPKGKPGKPVNEQVPDADTEDGALQLLNTFGVKTMYDENGDLVLVSFNQARPLNDSTDAELSAQRRAGVFAIGEIRKFLGEQIARVEDVFRSETVKDFEDHTRETAEATEGGRSAYEAMAEKISITGIGSVKDWTARHPVTGQIIVGSVKMWSPSGKAFAGILRGKMAKSAAEAASSSSPEAGKSDSSGGRKQINSDQEGDHKGQGIKGDKGGF